MTDTAKPGEAFSKWRFFHLAHMWGTLGQALAKNLTSDEVLTGHLCPILAGTPYPTEGEVIVNPRGFLSTIVFGSDQPIDSDWPPLKRETRSDRAIIDYLIANGHSCSTEAYVAAQVLIETGVYVDVRKRVLSQLVPNFVFMVSVLGQQDVDWIYHNTVKSVLKGFQLSVARSDEIRRPDLLMSSIQSAIAASRFVIADLTLARPNSYYELGYAHALGKPGIIIARDGTQRHFDVAGYPWNYWRIGSDFKPAFDAAVRGVMGQFRASSGFVPTP